MQRTRNDLRHYQSVGIDFLLEHPKAILGDEMGLGKTPQLYFVSEHYSQGNFLIVCPNTIKYGWKDEIEKWGTNYTITILEGNPLQRVGILYEFLQLNTNHRRNFLIVNYEGLLFFNKYYDEAEEKWRRKAIPWPALQVIKWTAIFADEAHRLKNRNAATTKAFKTIAKSTERVYLATGTPILNRVEELYSPLNILFPKQYKSYWKFVGRYCDVWQSEWGRQVDQLPPDHQNLQELREILSGIMIRRLKKNVLRELPPKTIQQLWVPLGDKQRRIYDEMEKKMLTEVNDKVIVAPVAIAQITRLKQIAVTLDQLDRDSDDLTGAKIDTLMDLLADVGKQVVVVSQFREVIRRLQCLLTEKGITHTTVVGGMKAEDRFNNIKYFADGHAQVFLGTIMACYQGINGLQDAADTMIFLDKAWVPGINIQMQDRLHRSGQKKNVTIIELLGKDTVEEDIEKLLNQKTELINSITDESTVDVQVITDIWQAIQQRRGKDL